MTRGLLLALAVSAVACGDDDLPPLTDATELRCPTPGDLPFRLDTRGFANDTNATVGTQRTRDKSEASDTLGNPSGPSANVYLDDAIASESSLAYRGAKGRTMENNGLFATPLPDERVSLWTYTADDWIAVGETTTDANGTYALPMDMTVANGQPVYAMLEADGSCAEHYVQLLPRGAKVVITDIDGTLTTDDNELLMQIGDASYVPKMKGAAVEMVRAWADKGYPIVYMTARSHVFRVETRGWLRDQGFPFGAVITANSLGDADGYKTAWGMRMLDTFGWVPVAAYGNATTDISAYDNAGIPKDITFIIGEHAGSEGTVAIANDDYASHIDAFIRAQPDNP